MPASKTMLTGGSFQDSLGNPLANGTLKFHLSQDCLVSGVGTVCSGIDVIIQLDSTGNVASSASTPSAPNQYIWSNLVMTPQNNYYRVTGYTAQGQIAFGGNNQQVGSGATFNLDNWTPNTVLSWFPSSQNLSLEVNGSQASSQVLQNLVEGAGITITDEGGGVISFASSVTLNVEVGGTPLSSTNPINFEAGTGIAVTNPSAGNVLITNTAPSSGPLNSSGFTGFAGPGIDSTVYLTGGWDQALISNVPNTILVYGFTLAYSIRITQAVITLINPGQPLGAYVGVFGLFDSLGHLLTEFSADADAVASNIPQIITLSPPVTIGPGFYYQAQAQQKPNGSGINVNTAFALGNATLSTPMVLTVNALQPVVGVATNTLNGGTTMPSTLGTITPYTASDVIGQIALPLWYS
jgi:hypothetical protein